MSNHKAPTHIFITLGSFGVSGALVSYDGALKTPRVHDSTYEKVSFQKEFSVDRFMNETWSALRRVVSYIEQKSGGVNKEVVVAIDSPWSLSEIRTIRYQKKTPFSVTKKFTQTLIQKETQSLKEKYDDRAYFEHEVIGMVLNGYAIENTTGQKGETFEIKILSSYAEKEFIKKLAEYCEKIFATKPEFHAFAGKYIQTSRLLTAPTDTRAYVNLDLANETTELAIIEEGTVTGLASFPFGVHDFIRKVQEYIPRSYTEILSMIRLYTQGVGDGIMAARLENAFEKAFKQWSDSYNHTIQEYKKKKVIPSTFFVVTHDDMVPVFREFLEKSLSQTYKKSYVIDAGQVFHGMVEHGKNKGGHRIDIPVLFIREIKLK